MLSPHNIFSPSNGAPIMSPSQDIVMGVYFLTVMKDEDVVAPVEDLRHFRNSREAILAYDYGQIDLHDRVVVRLERFEQIVNSEKGEIEALPSPPSAAFSSAMSSRTACRFTTAR